jgi:hypothetical protein
MNRRSHDSGDRSGRAEPIDHCPRICPGKTIFGIHAKVMGIKRQEFQKLMEGMATRDAQLRLRK